MKPAGWRLEYKRMRDNCNDDHTAKALSYLFEHQEFPTLVYTMQYLICELSVLLHNAGTTLFHDNAMMVPSGDMTGNTTFPVRLVRLIGSEPCESILNISEDSAALVW